MVPSGDVVIGVTERQLERLRKPAAHGALPGAHKADEHERSRAEQAADGMAALACLVLPACFIERFEAADFVHGPRSSTGAAACHKDVTAPSSET
jgi:hypothetical protein